MCGYMTIFDGTQVFAVKSMIIRPISSWMSSLPVRGREVVKVIVDFKVHVKRTNHIELTLVSIFVLTERQTESTKQVDLVEYYQNSDQFRNIQGKLAPIADSAAIRNTRNQKTPSYATGFFWQVSVC